MPNKKNKARIFIVSAPSGAGKTTIVKHLLRRFPKMIFSVSYTTRQPRTGEKDGVDYCFIQQDEFKQKIATNTWAEWAKVYDNYYGTDAQFIDTNLARGNNVVLDIDVQGTEQMLERYPDIVTIFIMPPSMETLRERLNARGTDSQAVIEKRLQDAKNEVAKKDLYRHIIINDHLPSAVLQLIAIVEKYIMD
jgi:guanylate kinase